MILLILLLPIVVLSILGALFSRKIRALGLAPATLLVWGVAGELARLNGFSIWQTLAAVFLCGASLQFGYLAGAMLLPQRCAIRDRQASGSQRR